MRRWERDGAGRRRAFALRVAPEGGSEAAQVVPQFFADRKAEGKATAAACRQYAKTPEQVARLDQLVAALNYEPRGHVISGIDEGAPR